ncbi:MAG: nucleotidyltransferase domain-containing protein [Candidatus Nezhaarchaeota archaeon]|nr:nucleotidyltransferase domain-containing protein [Candidatus Nezhaarchaeota archaeon]
MGIFTEPMLKRVEMLRSWRSWVDRIAALVKELVPNVEVYVIGSAVRGDQVAVSDVDVLVVSQFIPERPLERARIKALVEERLGLPYYHPFEIHLLKPEEARHYLRRSLESALKVL